VVDGGEPGVDSRDEGKHTVSSQSESAVSDIIDLKCLYYLGAYVASCVKNTMHSVNSA